MHLYTMFALRSRHYRPLLVPHLHTCVYFSWLPGEADRDADTLPSSGSAGLLRVLTWGGAELVCACFQGSDWTVILFLSDDAGVVSWSRNEYSQPAARADGFHFTGWLRWFRCLLCLLPKRQWIVCLFPSAHTSQSSRWSKQTAVALKPFHAPLSAPNPQFTSQINRGSS